MRGTSVRGENFFVVEVICRRTTSTGGKKREKGIEREGGGVSKRGTSSQPGGLMLHGETGKTAKDLGGSEGQKT